MEVVMEPREKSRISVCTGAGCRAWDAEKIIQSLKADHADGAGGVEVCRAACMNRCGGGASVRVACRKNIYKLRNAGEARSSVLAEWARESDALAVAV